MVVQHNLTAMNANRYLGINNNKLSKSLEKLSSGYAINRAGDNAAGLAVSEKMRSQIAGMTQGVKNAQDGISMVQTFEGALTETDSILQRMKTLADQMANGSYDDPIDRTAAQQEFLQLSDELDQIADTDFNGVIVLNGGRMADGALADENGSINYDRGIQEDLQYKAAVKDLNDKYAADMADYKAKAEAYNTAKATNVVDMGIVDGKVTGEVDVTKYTNTAATDLYKDVGAKLVAAGTKLNGATMTKDDWKKIDDVQITYKATFDANGAVTGYDIDKVRAFDALGNQIGDDIDGATFKTAVATADGGSNKAYSVTQTANGGVQLKQGTPVISNTVLPTTGFKTDDLVTVSYGAPVSSETYAPTNIGFGNKAEDGTDRIDTSNIGTQTTTTDAELQKATITLDTTTTTAAITAVKGGTATADQAATAKAAVEGYDKLQAATVEVNWQTQTATADTSFAYDAAGGAEKYNVSIDGEVMSNYADLDAAKAGAAKNSFFVIADADKLQNIQIGYKDKDGNTAVLATVALNAEVKEKDGAVAGKGGFSFTAKIDDYNLADGNADPGAKIVATEGAVDAGAAPVAPNKNDYKLTKEQFLAQKEGYHVSDSDAFNKSEAILTYKDNITLQVGARTKDAVNFTFQYNSDAIGDLAADLNCTAKGLGIDKLNLSTQEAANYAIDKIDQAINKISLVRGTFGAIQNRLEHKIDNMNVSIENLTSAESQIRDTNMPTEMMNFTKQQILAQASQSMLAQANQLPQSVLSLLQ